MHKLLIGLSLLCAALAPATAQVSVGISLPGVSIGINVPVYPSLLRVPGYPVYYAPDLRSNFFFYDGLYWVYESDHWYSSSWYNGPWDSVGPQDVPLYVLRVPVRYYRAPPSFFRGWSAAAPPRWDRHWGPQWVQQRPNWNRWDRRTAPRPVPLPSYQREYRGERYPQQVEQQRELRDRREQHSPRDEPVQRNPRERPPSAQLPQRPQPASPQVHSPRVQPEPRDARPQPAPPQRQQPAPRTPPGRDKGDDKGDGARGSGNQGNQGNQGNGKRDDDRRGGDNGRRQP